MIEKAVYLLGAGHPHKGRERSQLEGYRGSAEFRSLYFVPHDEA